MPRRVGSLSCPESVLPNGAACIRPSRALDCKLTSGVPTSSRWRVTTNCGGSVRAATVLLSTVRLQFQHCGNTGQGQSDVDCADIAPPTLDDPWNSQFLWMKGFFITSADQPGVG